MSSPVTDSPTRYAGQRAGIAVTVTLDKEALDLLRSYCPPGHRRVGRFLDRLVFEHHAREQERQRLRELLTAASGKG